VNTRPKAQTELVNTLIFGATGGIGSSLARILPAPLMLAARNKNKLRELELETGAYAVPADVCNELELDALAQEVIARGGLKVLIYTVGDIAPASILESSAQDLERVWRANILGVQLVLKHFAPLLEPNARVYLLGAKPELITFKNFSGYAASKAALDSLAAIARLEFQCAVTVVKPPAVDTTFWQKLGSKAPRNAISPDAVAQAILLDLTRIPTLELLL
jgi:NAD(P)-dependent dehydrogenase (short-subunit alcohol dehydrogenase family)